METGDDDFLSFLSGGAVRQYSVVLLNNGSQIYNKAGRKNKQITADMTAPRASIVQIAPIMPIDETVETPNVAQNKSKALVIIEISDESRFAAGFPGA